MLSTTSSPATSPALSAGSFCHTRICDTPSETAYNGAEGLVSDPLLSGDGSHDQAPLRQSPPVVRPALGARLLEVVSNARPAAAALTRKGSLLQTRPGSFAGFTPKSAQSDRKDHNQSRIFGDFFHGESAPIRLGPPVSPTKELDETEFTMEYRPALTERPSGGMRRAIIEPAPHASTPSTSSKSTSWFTRRSVTQRSVPSTASTRDEFADMDITSALFPHGPVDPLDPASYNDLLLNATSLLQRMQLAYREKVDIIASTRPEMDAQREEAEEAETRSRHLKMQLEDMGRRAQEQDRALREMAQQLAGEKLRAHEARERSLRLISSELAADEDGPAQRRGRRCARSLDDASGSDSGFESDADVASVFSGSSACDSESAPSIALAQVDDRADGSWPSAHSQRMMRRSRDAEQQYSGGRTAVWATVSALRDENRYLKRQVEEMQGALDACIEFVGVATSA